jgi:pimeloyl-ACP methyl ester carboxylesterase
VRLAADPAALVLPGPRSGKPEEISFGDAEMAGAIRLLSYHPSSVAIIPFLIDQAANGNFQPFAAQFAMIAESMSDALNIGMHNAVVCTEDSPWFETENISREQLDATYIGPVQLDSLEAMCSVWPAGVIDDEFKVAVTSDTPVLLLSGEADPITPPEYGDMAAVSFRNALHLTGKNQGHGQAPRGCVSDIIGDFVDAASVDELQTECMERLHAMPFFLGFGGPSP